MSASLPIDLLKRYRDGYEIFFETGTSEGDTVQTAIECGFRKIYSVELDQSVFDKVRRRFIASDRVSLMRGSSVEALATMIPSLDLPTIFFLDAHPDVDQGVSPVLEELDEISKVQVDFLIFIDDMNYMGMGMWTSRESIFSRLDNMDMKYSIIPNDRRSDALLIAWRQDE